MGSISPPFLEMLIIFPPFVSSVKERESPLHIGMRSPSNTLFFVTEFMCGVLILWVHFLFLMVFHISCFLLIMFLDGLAKATRTNDSKVFMDFVRSNIFCRFGVPRVIISDQGSHFCNRSLSSLLQKYGVVHRVGTTYHPQTNRQAEVFNREIKQVL